MSDLQKLTPFKFFALTNFPFIEADFDALTNYQLMCKIAEYINQIADRQNETIDAFNNLETDFTQLQVAWNTYKTTIDYKIAQFQAWFDNLDVQEEINTKLDQMAQDGSLSDLVEPFIPSVVTSWLNEHITQPTNPVIDSSLTVSGAGADAKITGDGIFSNRDTIIGNLIADSDYKKLLPTTFTHGSWIRSGSNVNKASADYRVCSTTKFDFDDSTTYNIASGFEIRRFWFNKTTEEFINFDGNWITGNVTFDNDKKYLINIKRVTEDTTEVADITEFANVVYIPDYNTTEAINRVLSANVINHDPPTLLFDRDTWVASTTRPPYIVDAKYRVRSVNTFKPEKYFILHIKEGFAVRRYWYDDQGNFVTFDGEFQTNRLAFYPEYSYLINIKRVTEDTTEIADINEFVHAIYIDNSIAYPQINILALGDSICRGSRNGGLGFVGDLDRYYINMGVGGACISNVHPTYGDSIHKFSDADTIPNQLKSYYDKSVSEIETAFTNRTKFYPDVILSEGGINDYIRSASLGDIPVMPITTDAEANSLDLATVSGGLQMLFYRMVSYYPDADRYFIITHKTFRPNGNYYPTYTNSAGYTQQELHDFINTICKIYNVKVIDVYNDSDLNTIYPQYRSSAENWHDSLDTDWCDYDGVHPLKYGYLHGYIPLIKKAIINSSVKIIPYEKEN